MDFQSPSVEEKPDVPPLTMILLLLVAVLFGNMLGSGLIYGLGSVMDIDVQTMMRGLDEDSPLFDRNFVRTANLIGHLLTFTVPALFVAWLFYKNEWAQFLQLHRMPVSRNVLLAILFIIAAFPVAQATYWINQQLPIPDWAGEMERSATGMLEGLLRMDSPGELLFNLLVVAVLPALGEELLFRGVIQQNLERLSRRPALAIWSTAILFSAIHLQFEGFIPRMLLGAALGYLFYWTRNLWVPIAAHFVFNGTQVVAQYVAGDELQSLDLEKVEDPQWAAALTGLLVMVLTGYALYNRTGSQKPES